MTVRAGGAVPLLYCVTVEMLVVIAVEPGKVRVPAGEQLLLIPGAVRVDQTVLGAQVPGVVMFCVYQTVLGLGVSHNVDGTQLLTQNVEEPEV